MVMKNCLYTYCYDGSGVAMRCAVEVICTEVVTSNAGQRSEPMVKVRFTEYVPPVDLIGGDIVVSDDVRWVRPGSFTEIGTNSPLTSWNWND